MATHDRPSRRRDFQIAIICALPLEYDAASLLVDEFWDQDGMQYGRTSGDTNTYRNGRIGMHDVVLMLLPNMGKATIAGSAACLRTSYPNLRLAFLVGVCGGVPSTSTHEALLGDVVIGETVVQYDFGRQYTDEFIPKEAAEGGLGVPNKDIRGLINYFKTEPGREDLRRSAANYLKDLQDAAVDKHYECSYQYPGFAEDKLFAATYHHKHRGQPSCGLCSGEVEKFCNEAARTSCAELGCDEGQLVPRRRLEKKRDLGQEKAQRPEIYIGRIASGDAVMKSGDYRDRIAKQHNVIAFEMEGAGIWNEVSCLVVKGICDYADSHKNKAWQPFAAATAAAVVKAMLGRYTLADDPEPAIRTMNFAQRDLGLTTRKKIDLGVAPSPSLSALVRFNAGQTLQDAISDFQSVLSNSQRRELQSIKAVPDADAVIVFTAQLDFRNRNRKGRSVASRLYTFLQSIRDFSTVVETFISSHPGIAALLWGCMRLTILVAFDFVSYYDALSKLFMNLGGLCPCLADYQILSSTSPRLRKALCNFYASVVRCCKHVIGTAQEWRMYLFRYPIGSFEQEFKPDADDIRRQSADVKEELSLAKAQADDQDQQLQNRERKEGSGMEQKLKSLLSLTGSNRGKLEAGQIERDERRARKRKQQLLESLSAHDYLAPLKQSRRKQCNSTAQWLFQTPEFERWTNGIGSPLLWCSGKIGSGKTILTASVIDKILTKKRGPDVFVSFFFVRFDDSQSLKAEVILKSIIRQALNQLGLSEQMEASLEQAHLGLSSEFGGLLGLLQKIVAALATLYIVIDGLDECEKSDRNELLKALSSLTAATSNTRLFLASRDNVSGEIKRRFPSLEHLSMSCPSARSDIATYVESAIQDKLQSEDLVVGDPSLIEEIKQVLTEGADGMFLWVAFQIDELCLQHCDDDIRKAIKNLPKDLVQTFNRALGRIVSRGHAEVARQAFRWITAARRPLSLDELGEAIFIEIGQQYSKPGRVSSDIHRISSWCENLVHVDEELRIVQFAHRTVRQFFLEKPPESQFNGFLVELEDADHYIGEVCVTYLNFNDFKTTLARRPQPLLPISPAQVARTALKHGPKLAAPIQMIGKLSSGTRESSAVVDIVGTLASFKRDDTEAAKEKLQLRHPFLKFASSNWILHTTRFREDTSITWDLWEKMILDGHDLAQNPWGSEPLNANSSLILEWSYKVRHYALIRLITRFGGLSDTDRSQMMQRLAIEGDITLLNIFLEGGKPGDEVDRLCQAAARGGHLNIVERLLAAGANVNAAAAAAYGGRTALQAAAEGGYFGIVERLLAAGADVNAAAAYDGRTALQAAARGGHLDIVKRLLAAGADVNAAAAYDDRTALQMAAGGGHLDIVERLLAAGANVNAAAAAAYGGRTALQAAARGGHLNIVERLQRAGAIE